MLQLQLTPKKSFSSSLILVGIGPLKYDIGMISMDGLFPGTTVEPSTHGFHCYTKIMKLLMFILTQ